jgi:hypothetical protein
VPVLSNNPSLPFGDQRHLSLTVTTVFPEVRGSLRMEPYIKPACYV